MTISILLLSLTVFSQNTLVIKELHSHRNLEGANVLSLKDAKLLVSDIDGKVNVEAYSIGDVFKISFIGYQTITHTLTKGLNSIYLKTDYELLDELTVVGYQNSKKLYEIAGSYAINNKVILNQFNDESLVRSMNTLPGIRFEERSPNSYRISIRGNLLRAPYGVRNVKVYWNDIPYTDAAGNTTLNLLDVNNIGKVEVIKGPSSSIYGAGMGGVLNMYSDLDKISPISGDVSYSAASFGYNKVLANFATGNDNHQFSVKYAQQKGDGYRDHTNSEKKVLQMSSAFYTSQKRTLRANILYSDLFYQTPGGLTKEQYDANPRQARAGVAEKNASIDHQSFLAGFVQDYVWNETLKNTTSIYLSGGTKENPFTNNYELEKLNTYGGRTSLDIRTSLWELPVIYTAGAEMNIATSHANNHDNDGGYAGALRYEDELKTLQSFVFLQANINLTDTWLINLGASLNYLNYDFNRLRDVAQSHSYKVTRTFNTEFMPRIGVVGKLSKQFSIHGSISSGFSPPTIDEIRTSDGSINESLEAEKAINYEIGIRGNTKDQKLYYDITTFWLQQSETIVSKSKEQGTVVFENAGSTSQFGLELSLGYTLIKDPLKSLSLLKIHTSYTHHNFSFNNYIKRKGSENIDYSGNDLTGTAPNIAVTTIQLESKSGLYLNLMHNFTDKIPLNDANTVYGDSYQLVTSKFGWISTMNDKNRFDVFFGVDNVFNEKYSLGNDLNAFGNRYFNAAPERNFYGGIKFYFN
ncbi:MAG: TonB-dependent receptor [Flavobacteriaceae bacterium]|nr:TonB-dependent receptor [Flavobacteriaceae bacterium]